MRKALAGFIVGVIAAGCGAAAAGTGNDVTRNEDQYREYFKKEGNGDKNYQYTETEFKDTWGRVCTVATGYRERTIAMSCEFPPAR